MDFDGLAWGAQNLRPSDGEQAAQGRGFDGSTRALATNLAYAGADWWDERSNAGRRQAVGRGAANPSNSRRRS
jgi:hypothetical protein